MVGYFRPYGFDLIPENCHERQGVPSQTIDPWGSAPLGEVAPRLLKIGAIGHGGAMPSDGRDAVGPLEDAIRAYVSAHPGAADNAAGIQKWWLPPDMANGPKADVEAALAAFARCRRAE